MRLAVLGCSGPWPDPNGACSGYLVTYGEHSLLLDMGSGVLSRLLRYQAPEELDGVLLSHWHHDHASDLLVYQYYLEQHRGNPPIYAPLDEHPLRNLCGALNLQDLHDAGKLGPFALNVCPVEHSVPTYAWKVQAGGKTLVYTGDVSKITDSLVGFAHDADLLICDAAFLSADWHEGMPHLSAKMAGELAKTTKGAHLLISHYSPKQSQRDLLSDARSVYPKVTLATAGLQLSV